MSFLTGSFALKRNVSSPELVITGEAKFYPESENTIEYYEHGHYFLDGTAQEFYQKQYFIYDSGLLKICNSKKEIMHKAVPIFLSESACTFSHAHLCKNDEYLLNCRIAGNTIFMDYKITGPSKNYLIHTRLEKKSR